MLIAGELYTKNLVSKCGMQRTKILLLTILTSAFFYWGTGQILASNVSYPTETNILMNTPSMTLAVGGNSAADSVIVNDSTITVSITAPDSFVLRSDNRYTLNNDAGISSNCTASSNTLTIQPNSGSQTVVITPSTQLCTLTTNSGNSGSSSNNSSGNSASAPRCTDQAPGAKAPWLYGAIPQPGGILLYFTEADNPVDRYVLQFGTKSGVYLYGSTNIGGKGSRTYLVQALLPNTTYYFRVRGGNGCATGTWSNEISATSKPLFSQNSLDIVTAELNPAGQATGTQSASNQANGGNEAQASQTTGYKVKVTVVDTRKRPVSGVRVTIHSTPKEGTTNKDGVAEFSGVEAGQHIVLIAYKGYSGEQSINLTGDVKEFDLNITVQQSAFSLSLLAYAIIGLLTVVILTLATLLIWTKVRKPK